MGLTKTTFEKLKNVILKNFNNKTGEKSYLELGIQESVEPLGFRYLRDILANNFKNYFSIDLHKIEGVTICDLSIYHDNLFSVDVLTNFGTSEHVEYEEGQYNCWKNMHNWLKVGGIVIHEIPEKESWKGHCRYYVTHEFFHNLENYGYEILELDNHKDGNGNLVWCVLKKTSNENFMDLDSFYKHMSIDKTINMDTIHITNNPKKLK